jgi:hypothetical protein
VNTTKYIARRHEVYESSTIFYQTFAKIGTLNLKKYKKKRVFHTSSEAFPAHALIFLNPSHIIIMASLWSKWGFILLGLRYNNVLCLLGCDGSRGSFEGLLEVGDDIIDVLGSN